MIKILITGEIGWSVTPDSIREQLNNANGKDLDIEIASPGGYVSDGIEIFNLFRDYKRNYPSSQILATIKGVAASMATYLAVNPAFDLIVAEDNAVFMIHNAWGGAVGDYREMQTMAGLLEGLTGIIAAAYAQKTGKSMQDIRKMMDDETWLFSDGIAESGFVDEIIRTDNEKNKNMAIAQAKLQFKNISEKMSDKKYDVEKIAAHISNSKSKIIKEQDVLIPADDSAGKNTLEGTMTLEEFLSQTPAAKIEYENALHEAKEAGKQAGRESLQATIKTAAKYLGADSQYPAPIKSLAVDVLNGIKTAESLETTVTAFDAMKETNNSNNAVIEQPDDVLSQQIPLVNNGGEIQTEVDYQAAIARLRQSRGMEA